MPANDTASRDDGVDRARWDAAHRTSGTPTLSRLKRETICAALPDGVDNTTLWPSWPLPEVAAELHLTVGETLVDLACGRGEIGLWIANRLDAGWVGVDPSPVGLKMAAELAATAARSRTTVEGHFYATGLDDHQADAVLIVDAIHFAVDLARTFREVKRVLRPGRRLVIVGPQTSNPRPALIACGFSIERDDRTPDWRDLLGRFLARAREEADALRAELDEQSAANLLSRNIDQLTGVDHGLIAARAPSA
ncbi:MAG: class I SAM-dependent methyltransferase [Acidimicrobiales bacterium]